MHDRIRRRVAEMAASVGADLPARPRGTFGRLFVTLLGMLRRKPEKPPTLAVFDNTADKPSDLDDPFNDPGAERRVGTALAQKAETRKRGCEGSAVELKQPRPACLAPLFRVARLLKKWLAN